jgi:ATP-binding cassette, subfamily B, multidrug efflux pump
VSDKFKWLWRFYRYYPKVIAILLILTPIQVAIAVTVPRMVGFTIDYLKQDQVPEHWLAQLAVSLGGYLNLSPGQSFGLAFVLMGLVAVILYAYFQSWRAWMNVRLEWHFRQDAFDRITEKGPDFFNRFRTGDMVTRLTDDVAEKLSWFACSGIFRFYEATLSVIFIILMMISIDPTITMWTAGPLPLLILIFFKTSSLLDRRYEALQRSISVVNDAMEACFSGIRVVKAYVREAAQQAGFDKATAERRQAEIDTVKSWTIIESMYHYIWQFAVVVVLFVGGYKVLFSGLTLGDMATFIYYVTWLVFPMFDVGQFLVKSRQSAVSINRLVEMEDVKPLVANTGTVAGNGNLEGPLEFDHVSFGFDGCERPIIDDVSFRVEPGETVAVVGRVGAGKSWLVNMVPRLVEPTGGRVLLNDHDLREFRLEDLRRSIGYVPQEPALFSDTVRNNIVFGREGISDTLLEWALEVSQLKQEVAHFPQGMDTPIGTRGMSISGGQKQRLGLARALVGKPRILILDDCTSALDSRTEAALWERLHEVMPQMTAILITHRPDTLQRADRIFVLRDGKVVEHGRHLELQGSGGEYARIYRRFELAEQVS